MKKPSASTKGIEKKFEEIKKKAEKINERIETAFETLQANKFSITNSEYYITTIRGILNDLENSSDQLRQLQIGISASN